MKGEQLCRAKGCHSWAKLIGPGYERKTLYRCGECWIVTDHRGRYDRELREGKD
jgi:hypothetical protein